MNTCIKFFLKNLRAGNVPEGFMTSKKYILERPASWRDCVRSARLRFEKYFNHRVHHSLIFYSVIFFYKYCIKWFYLTLIQYYRIFLLSKTIIMHNISLAHKKLRIHENRRNTDFEINIFNKVAEHGKLIYQKRLN